MVVCKCVSKCAHLAVGGVQRMAAVARERSRLGAHVCAVGAVDEGEGEVEPAEDAAALEGDEEEHGGAVALVRG